MKTLGIALFGCGCAAIGVGVGWQVHSAPDAAATTRPADETAQPLVTVKTQVIRRGTLTQSVTAYGSITAAPSAAITLSLPFDAVVQQVLTEAGRSIAIGTPILELSATAETQLQFQQAEDALAAANVNLEQARQRRERQLATNADVSTAEQAQRSASTQLQSLQQRGVGKSTTVKATTAGIVTQLNLQKGQVVPAGTAMATLVTSSELQAVIGVEPSSADQLQIGGEASLHDVMSGESASISGSIVSIAQQINPQTRLRDVVVSLPAAGKLLQGVSVSAELPARRGEGLIVPRSAVLPDDDALVLFSSKGSKVTRHEVKVELSNVSSYLIEDPSLHEGESIVVAGNAELEDGMSVSAESATEPGTAEAEK